MPDDPKENGTAERRGQRLFVYGSLKPGGSNEHVLLPLDGQWEPAVIRGSLVPPGWAPGLNYPGLMLDDRGDDVPGFVFSAVRLDSFWLTLDRFEGAFYRRVASEATLANGASVRVQVYVIRDGPTGR